MNKQELKLAAYKLAATAFSGVEVLAQAKLIYEWLVSEPEGETGGGVE